MDVLTLIEQARSVGLTLSVRDGCLTIRGPRSAAPLVSALGTCKAEVIAALAARDAKPTWEELASLRWGPAQSDPEGDIVLDGPPDPDRLGAVLDALASDPEAIAEREAMRAEAAAGPEP
jgi:hypothetical protein